MMRIAPCAHRNIPVRLILTPDVGRQILDRHGRPAAPGIVEQDIQAAEAARDFREKRVDACLVSDIGHNGMQLTRPLAAQGARFFEFVGTTTREYDLVANVG